MISTKNPTNFSGGSIKKLLLLLLFIPLVFATDYSGDFEDRVIEDMINGQTMIIGAVKQCVGEIKVDVDANLEISDNEINITGCERTREFNSKSERWECPCNNPFDIELRVKKNTINKYEFDIDYSKTEVVVTDNDNSGGGSSGGGGGAYNYYNNKNNANDTTSNPTVINNNKALDSNTRNKDEVIAGANFPASDQSDEQKSQPTPPQENKSASMPNMPKGTGGTILMIASIILMIFGGAGIGIYKLLFTVSDDNDFDENDVKDLIYDMEEEDGNVFNKTETDIILEEVEKSEMSDLEMESIVDELKAEDQKKKENQLLKKTLKPTVKKPTVKDVDDILKHLDDN